MFHKLWAHRQKDTIVLEKLPYYTPDPSTGNLVEMTNCSFERKKQLGWYEVVFINNQGNRANTFYEDMGSLVYNETMDRVECHSFFLKNNWREILFTSIKEKVLSLDIDIENQDKINTWLNKIQDYFFDEKYNDQQLAKYHDILYSYHHDFVLAASQQIYTNSNGIQTIEFIYPSEQVFRQNETVSKYILQNLEIFKNKKISLNGVSCYQDAVLLERNNIKCKIIDHIYFDKLTEYFIATTMTVMHAILNDVFIDIVEDVEYSFNDDIIIFNGAFDKEWAETNWNIACRQKQRGKQVLICSPSIWSGSNETIKVDQNKLELIFESDVGVIFAPKV